MINDMPWYDSYIMIIEGRARAEQELKEATEPRLKNESVKRFFDSIGADYQKNELVTEEINRASEMAYYDDVTKQYRDEINFANALEKAVTEMDYDSIKKLSYYREDPQYGNLISQVMFYIGLKKIENDHSYILNAYLGLTAKYPMSDIGKFLSEGSKYYIQYWKSVRECVKNERNSSNFPMIRGIVNERIMNYQLMFNQYTSVVGYNSFINESRALISSISELIS
ncbi:hypothetical protein [Butyrivibrio sp. VCB2001]|uniref:hypothetical protein n=1 Tax=Butyrivibrio sp. VCB2001 TaxID=1280667 RepID=UPI00041228D9|nr:hypothetical protein [Butyrivibrio sp. VCB2001]